MDMSLFEPLTLKLQSRGPIEIRGPRNPSANFRFLARQTSGFHIFCRPSNLKNDFISLWGNLLPYHCVWYWSSSFIIQGQRPWPNCPNGLCQAFHRFFFGANTLNRFWLASILSEIIFHSLGLPNFENKIVSHHFSSSHLLQFHGTFLWVFLIRWYLNRVMGVTWLQSQPNWFWKRKPVMVFCPRSSCLIAESQKSSHSFLQTIRFW